MSEAVKLKSPDTTNFYRDLKAFTQFKFVTDTKLHTDLPSDWDVIITDVIGSTDAIKAGRYKDVNMVGAACIAAVTNIDKSVQIPFVFGGDGATFAAPSFMREKIKDALAGARAMSRDAFNLDLRVGVVPVQVLLEAKHWVRVGKFQMSEFISQPAFSGRGWEHAEKLIKDPEKGKPYMVGGDRPTDQADFSGLECRWKGIPSTLDCKLAILVVSADSNPDNHAGHYQVVMDAITRIFGGFENVHPVREENMNLSYGWGVISKEAKIRTQGQGAFATFKYYLRAALLNMIGTWLFKNKKDTKDTQWSRYKSDFVKNSDFRKFDGMLRMVIDASHDQRKQLEVELAELHAARKIMYGVHASPEAIVTCLVADYNGFHTHFVDGSDGGYAMAAVQLKAQLKEFKSKALTK